MMMARRISTLLASLLGLLCAKDSRAQHSANSASAHYYDGALANVACQNDWIQTASAGSFGGMVTAWHNTNSPGYNAQCGKCMKLTSTGRNAGNSIYVTVIDYKGWDGFDVNVPVSKRASARPRSPRSALRCQSAAQVS
jgi:hypothetical protein